MAKKRVSSGKKRNSLEPLTPDEAVSENTGDAPVETREAGDERKAGSSYRRGVRFPIVGIGASAGGLEAFEAFFKNMDPNSGMAFVLVQHLDPTHRSILSELIGRFARMPVEEATQGVEVEPNHVYVIPANRDLAILNNRLQLLDPSGPRHLRLSIDYFFRSLAQEAGHRAIGIILSGTGTDGTLGLRAIKGEGGLALVQDTVSAAYDGMPRSAIATGLADAILPPSEMARQLLAYARDATFPRAQPSAVHPDSPSDRERLFVLLRSQTGHDFSLYKDATITRRIQKRMAINGLDSEAEYVRLLQQSPHEVDALWKEFLIRVTQFFRDPDVFKLLDETVIPALLSNKANDDPIRIWVPACSTGEEAYSIAMLIHEHRERSGKKRNVQIFATDIDQEALDAARAGSYPDSIVSDVSTDRLRRFFSKVERSYVVGKELRSLLVFSSHDVAKDPPFSRMDLVSCRNLLIYMKPELQARVLGLFHYSLTPSGYLLLGSSETTGAAEGLFKEEHRKLRLFQRKPGWSAVSPRLPPHGGFAQSIGLSGLVKAIQSKDKTPTLREATEATLLDVYAPNSVVVSEEGTMLYVHGSTKRYLEAVTGEASLNIVQLARRELRLPLSAALREAAVRKQESCYKGLRLEDEGGTFLVDLRVRPFNGPAPAHSGFLVVFEDAASGVEEPESNIEHPADDVLVRRIAMLEQELASTREVLQTANEELQTSNEELGSTVEELQSTNEELLTSQEELRSVNEELLTVNAELESKVDELAEANADKENLLASSENSTIFLDLDLSVKWFSPAVTRIVNLISSDVGRPIRHISHHLLDTDLPALAEEVLETLRPVNREVRDDKGTSYELRITLYRTDNNAISGTVIGLSDVTERKRVQHLELFRRLVDSAPDATVVVDSCGAILMINTRAEELFGWTCDQLAGQPVEVLLPERSREQHQKHRNDFARDPQARTMAADRVLMCLRKNGTEFFGQIALSPIETESGILVSTAIRDATPQVQSALAMRRINGIYKSMCHWDEAQIEGSLDEKEALADLCRMLVEESGYTQCWVDLETGGAMRRSEGVTQAGVPPEHRAMLNPQLRALLGTDECTFIRYIQEDPRYKIPLGPLAAAWGFGSVASLPLNDGSPRIGVLVLHAADPAAFDESEKDLLQILARRVSRSCAGGGLISPSSAR